LHIEALENRLVYGYQVRVLRAIDARPFYVYICWRAMNRSIQIAIRENIKAGDARPSSRITTDLRANHRDRRSAWCGGQIQIQKI